jgi:hypothetical protein
MVIDNPITNNNPSAVIFVMHNCTPPGSNGYLLLDENIGVWYNSSMNRWMVFNESGTAMPLNRAFNILVYAQPTPLILFPLN